MKKYVANIITGSRIAFSLPLVFIPLASVWFAILYLFCGLTDMIDGTIARKTGAVSKFGARLDTASDFVFMCVCGIKILPFMHLSVWLWLWIVLIGLIKTLNMTLFFIKKKKLIANHSVLNKTAGFALFLLPLTMTLLDTAYSIATICALASIALIQEVNFTLKEQEIL